MGVLSDVGTGAAAGSVFGPVGTLVGAGIGLLPSAFKFFSGSSQKSQANAINPVNPRYEINRSLVDNANILRNRYSNYTMPGYTQAQNKINSSYQDAFSKGTQGASSGGDIQDLAAKLAYGKNVADGNLETQNAQGKDAALGQYLEANATAGQQYQDKNAYDRDQYNRALLQKAALTQAGNTNEYNAIDTGSSVLSGYLNPKATVSGVSNNINPTVSTSIFSSPSSTAGSGNAIDWNKLKTNYLSRYGSI